jgi:hypothetical protein
MISLYHYGYIQGKRAERKRKNLVSQNWETGLKIYDYIYFT